MLRRFFTKKLGYRNWVKTDQQLRIHAESIDGSS